MQVQMIDDQLREFGIREDYSGYFYFHTALLLAFREPECLHRMTTSVYPVIGEKYGMTACAIERAMGYALKQAWDSGTGTLKDHIGVKPTNREFLALTADAILSRQLNVWLKENEIPKKIKSGKVLFTSA